MAGGYRSACGEVAAAMTAAQMRRVGLGPGGWGRLFLGIAHMVRNPRRLDSIEHPLARESAATLVQILGHRYGRDWLTETTEGMSDEPPDVAPPIPDAIPLKRERRPA